MEIPVLMTRDILAPIPEENIEEDQRRFPDWRIGTIKAFSLISLQCMLQTYACAYVWKKHWSEGVFDKQIYPYIIA